MGKEQGDKSKQAHKQRYSKRDTALARTNLEQLILRIVVEENIQESLPFPRNKPTFPAKNGQRRIMIPMMLTVWDFLKESNEKLGGKRQKSINPNMKNRRGENVF